MKSRSRGDLLQAALTSPQASWQASLEENFQVRRYVFDSRVQATKDFTELAFDGRSSAIGAALKTIADRYKGQPLAGVLLFSDGNATDIAGSLADYSGLPPIYPVVIGRDEPIKDIAINKVTVSQTAFEDAPGNDSSRSDHDRLLRDKHSGPVARSDCSVQCASNKPDLLRQKIGTASVSRPNLLQSAPEQTPQLRAAVAPDTAKASGLQEKIVAEQTERAPREGEHFRFGFRFGHGKPGSTFIVCASQPEMRSSSSKTRKALPKPLWPITAGCSWSIAAKGLTASSTSRDVRTGNTNF